MFYVAKFAEGIYVLHACEKRTEKLAKPDLHLVKTRHRALLNWRNQRDEADFRP